MCVFEVLIMEFCEYIYCSNVLLFVIVDDDVGLFSVVFVF